jgi:hypothetical protein
MLVTKGWLLAGPGHNNQFLDIEATVGEEDEEDEESKEGNDGESESQTYCPSLQLHLLDGFIEDKPANNSHYMPFRQLNQTSDHEGGWHDCVASLAEHYASGSKFKTTAEDNCRNERPQIDPVVVFCIENITTHDYPFWRVRCRVSY